ncbi:MAG TPA: hypothetical protein VMH81_24320 [Bryobacteraceae bacterium]|nr:hypothetical protein [Bryobacteraceae bacterium]
MATRLPALFLLPALLLTAASKKTVSTARGENEDLILTATLYLEPGDVKELIGSDLGGHYIVFEVKVDPKYGKEISIDRDDFQLRTEKDGEKAKPYAASQIAGPGVLVLSDEEGEAKAKKSRGWSMGGIGMGVGGGGAGSGDKGPTKATMKDSDKQDPLEKVLASRILPEKKTDQPVSGLLYFPMEKQKMKDLELTYGGKENRISLKFK